MSLDMSAAPRPKSENMIVQWSDEVSKATRCGRGRKRLDSNSSIPYPVLKDHG